MLDCAVDMMPSQIIRNSTWHFSHQQLLEDITVRMTDPGHQLRKRDQELIWSKAVAQNLHFL